MIRFSLPLFALAALGCNSSSFKCEDERVGNWAIQFSVEQGQDSECPYEGTVTLLDNDTARNLICEPSGDACACSGGTEFGTYEVLLTNRESGQTDRAVITVDAASSPVCIDRDADERFAPLDDGSGGAGGAGGASN